MLPKLEEKGHDTEITVYEALLPTTKRRLSHADIRVEYFKGSGICEGPYIWRWRSQIVQPGDGLLLSA